MSLVRGAPGEPVWPSRVHGQSPPLGAQSPNKRVSYSAGEDAESEENTGGQRERRTRGGTTGEPER